jgi:hypothetical protein
MLRWILCAVLAAIVTAGLVYVMGTPQYVSEQMEVAPARLIGQVLAVFAIIFPADRPRRHDRFVGDAQASYVPRERLSFADHRRPLDPLREIHGL